MKLLPKTNQCTGVREGVTLLLELHSLPGCERPLPRPFAYSIPRPERDLALPVDDPPPRPEYRSGKNEVLVSKLQKAKAKSESNLTHRCSSWSQGGPPERNQHASNSCRVQSPWRSSRTSLSPLSSLLSPSHRPADEKKTQTKTVG